MRTFPCRAISLLLCLMLLIACVASCSKGGGRGEAPDTTADVVVTPDANAPNESIVPELAAALTGSASLSDVRPAVYESLGRAGVRVMTQQGATRASTADRTMPVWLFDFQADSLARDLLESQGWTLATFAQAISEYPGGPGPAFTQDPALLVDLLREWALAAEDDPDNPEAFVPLLLAEIARSRGGAADFTSDAADPNEVMLSYFELYLFTAGWFAAPAGGTGATQPESWSAPPTAVRYIPFLETPAYAEDSNPCAWIERKWGKDVQEIFKGIVGTLADLSLDAAMTAAQNRGSSNADLLGGMKTAGNVLAATNFLVSMISLYGGYSVTVSWDPAVAHYVAYDGSHGTPEVRLTAKVSARPLMPEQVQKCLDWAGLDQPDKGTVTDCVVQWVPVKGTPKHATISGEGMGTGGTAGGRLEQRVNEDGEAVLILEPSVEKAKFDDTNSSLKKDVIVINAEVTTYRPNIGKLIGAVISGPIGALEAAKGWLNKMAPKKVVCRIPVEWHAAQEWEFSFTYEGFENGDCRSISWMPWGVSGRSVGNGRGAWTLAFDEKYAIDDEYLGYRKAEFESTPIDFAGATTIPSEFRYKVYRRPDPENGDYPAGFSEEVRFKGTVELTLNEAGDVPVYLVWHGEWTYIDTSEDGEAWSYTSAEKGKWGNLDMYAAARPAP